MDSATVGNSLVSFRPWSDANGEKTGLRVRDELGRSEFVVRADEPVSLQPASRDRFVTPVDAAVSFTASELRLPSSESVLVRDATGEHLGEFVREVESFPRGDYYLEVSGTTKTYLALYDVSFTGVYRDGGTYRRPHVDFDESTTVTLGTRSIHDRPQATITIPDDPEALLEVLPYLGSAIKEWSCERSWPTLRGHPPAIERGDELHVPDVLSKPDTGVTIAVSPNHADAYRVAPLVYYLGADVVPGEEAELRLDTGHTEPLRRSGRTLEEAVDQLLARCLLLDSLVRVGGYYSFPRREYDEIAPHLPFYPPELYDASIPEQLMEYLEVPFDVLESHVPQRPLTALIRPDTADVPMLPALVDSLARVRVTDTGRGFEASDATDSVALATTHLDGPPGTTHLTPSTFSNALGHTLTDPDDLTVAFVGPDAEESRAAYDTVALDGRKSGAGTVDVSAHADVTPGALRQLLAAGIDFLYIGSDVTDEGVVCSDGVLPFDALVDAVPTMFALGGPGAFGAGAALVEAGATSGVVDASLNGTEVGRLASYLASGFPLAVAADLAELSTPTRLVGDPTLEMTPGPGLNIPAYLSVESVDEDDHRVTLVTNYSSDHPSGAVSWFDREFAHDDYFLIGGAVEQPFTFDTGEAAALLRDGDLPVRCNGEVYHGEEPAERFLRRSARDAPERRTR